MTMIDSWLKLKIDPWVLCMDILLKQFVGNFKCDDQC